MRVDVLVVNFNTAAMVQDMFAALRRSAVPGVELRCLVVDNASSDNSVEVLRSCGQCDVLIENRENIGFGRANNQLLGHLRGDFVLLLNTDAFVSPETLAASLAYMQQDPACGVLGVKLVGRDGELQPSCRTFPTPLRSFLLRTGLDRLVRSSPPVDDLHRDHSALQECDWVPGCYYLVRRSVIERVGLFDPRFFLYCEEVDHCRRVKAAGWKVVFLPSTTVIHIGGESARTVSALNRGRQIPVLQLESELLYVRKHHGVPGLLAHVVLGNLAEAIVAAKDLVKGRGTHGAGAAMARCHAMWRLLRRTAWATQPTR